MALRHVTITTRLTGIPPHLEGLERKIRTSLHTARHVNPHVELANYNLTITTTVLGVRDDYDAAWRSLLDIIDTMENIRSTMHMPISCHELTVSIADSWGITLTNTQQKSLERDIAAIRQRNEDNGKTTPTQNKEEILPALDHMGLLRRPPLLPRIHSNSLPTSTHVRFVFRRMDH